MQTQEREKVKPTPNRFGTLLRKCREQAPRRDGGIGYTQLEVEQLSIELADSLPESEPISHSHLSAVEVGRHRLTDPMLRCLIYIYNMEDAAVVELMKLPREEKGSERPIPLYVRGNTPRESLGALQLMLDWASQGAALTKYIQEHGANVEPGLASLVNLVENSAPLDSADPYAEAKAEVLEQQRQEVSSSRSTERRGRKAVGC